MHKEHVPAVQKPWTQLAGQVAGPHTRVVGLTDQPALQTLQVVAVVQVPQFAMQGEQDAPFRKYPLAQARHPVAPQLAQLVGQFPLT